MNFKVKIVFSFLLILNNFINCEIKPHDDPDINGYYEFFQTDNLNSYKKIFVDSEVGSFYVLITYREEIEIKNHEGGLDLEKIDDKYYKYTNIWYSFENNNDLECIRQNEGDSSWNMHFYAKIRFCLFRETDRVKMITEKRSFCNGCIIS